MNVAVDMDGHYSTPITQDALLAACLAAAARGQWPTTSPDRFLDDGYMIVCLEPYHQHSHPVMLKRKP